MNKLFFPEPVRYSEDIDFVQLKPGPIKQIVKTIQELIDPWLGTSNTESRKDGFRINYQFIPESDPEGKRRIKLEINTREHFTFFPINELEYTITSRWYSGTCRLRTYDLNELLATKLRALYQRKKGRDLFDLHWAIRNLKIDAAKVVNAFKSYIQFQGNTITARQYLLNLEEKFKDFTFQHDIDNYLRSDIDFDKEEAFENVKQLIRLI